jgi:ABC-type glycerol-3-phosphate transport system substrate-binding protein
MKISGSSRPCLSFVKNIAAALTAGASIFALCVGGAVFISAQSAPSGSSVIVANKTFDMAADDETSFEVQVAQPGEYLLAVTYAPKPGKRASVELSVSVDGGEELQSAFGRTWVVDNDPKYDNMDNMLRPTPQELPGVVQTDYFMTYEGADQVYDLTAGAHSIHLICVKNEITIYAIEFKPNVQLPRYSKPSGQVYTGEAIDILAPQPYRMSDQTLTVNADSSNPYLEPFSYTNTRYNTISSSTPGQWLEWEVNVPKDGLYQISAVYRENMVIGLPVVRTLYIDGQIPFEEAKYLTFPYGESWQRTVFSDENKEPYLFSLTKGRHVLRLAVSMGETAELLAEVNECTSILTDIYTDIIMVTGPSPDSMRDYHLDTRLPELLPNMKSVADRLTAVINRLDVVSGGRNDATVLQSSVAQIYDMVEFPDTIASRMQAYRDNVLNISVWIRSNNEMPVDLYELTLSAPDASLSSVKPEGLEAVWFEICRFFASFFITEGTVGNVYEYEDNVISVWTMYGKEYSEILKNMIDNEFTAQTGIKVNYNILANANTLLFSVASGIGPDACLLMDRAYPVDFGLRGALVELQNLDGFNELVSRFQPTALNPYTYNGRVFGLPTTMTVPVMYVRTDIFEDLGLEIPETWTEIYDLIGSLGDNNLQLSIGGDAFNMLLLQRGMNYFSEDLSRCNLDDSRSIAAFKQWTDFFTLYGLPVVADSYNRFVTGEMPLIMGMTDMYPMISAAATHLHGKWGMYVVPGIEDENGNVNHAVSGGGMSSFILKSTPPPQDDAWEFLKWFYDVDVQSRFAQDLESLFGIAGRYFSATLDAQFDLNWNRQELATLRESYANAEEIPFVPGTYFVTRHISNAYNEVVINNEMPRDSIIKYTEIINSEIEAKIEELGIENSAAARSS